MVEHGLELPVADFVHSNWHMFQVVLPLERLSQSRSQIMLALKERGIGTGVHYPIITSFALYREHGYSEQATPVANMIGQSILTLPLFPTMTNTDVDRVVKALQEVLA